MDDISEIENDLICSICLDVADYRNVVETKCCHKLYCKPCLGDITQCPNCRKQKFEAQDSVLARRLISGLKVCCQNSGCKERIERGHLKSHMEKYCHFKRIHCPAPECDGFSCPANMFVEHLTNTHSRYMLENYKRLWQSNSTMSNSKHSENQNATAASNIGNDPLKLIKPIHNRLNRIAYLGMTGKFYCGGQLDGSRCRCCNGICGPVSGCNCSACMILDVTSRNLPRGWLVNQQGAPCVRRNEHFFCGRVSTYTEDDKILRCNLDDKEQCDSCKVISKQYDRRYSSVWSTHASE